MNTFLLFFILQGDLIMMSMILWFNELRITVLTQISTAALIKISTFQMYTCQLFLRYKREIFILGVLGFFKTTRPFPNIPEEVRSFPKTSEFFRRCPKSAEGELAPSAFHYREEGIVIHSFYTWFSFLTWVWVNIVLEIVSSKTATTHIFQSGVRNWPASVSRREIEVFNPQAWELAGIL